MNTTPPKPHPQAKFIGWWTNRHPDSKRFRVAVFLSPERPYMVLVEVPKNEATDQKMRGANDGDNSPDCND